MAMRSNDIKCKCMFVFPLKQIAGSGLIYATSVRVGHKMRELKHPR